MKIFRTSRYFCVPEELVSGDSELKAIEFKRAVYSRRVKEFIKFYKTEYALEYKAGGISNVAYPAFSPKPSDNLIPVKGWRFLRYDFVDGKRVQIVAPDKRIKEGKAIAEYMDRINKAAIAPDAGISYVAKKYGLNKTMCIQQGSMLRNYTGLYKSGDKAYYFCVPAYEGERVLPAEYRPPDDRIIELMESEYVQITKELWPLKKVLDHRAFCSSNWSCGLAVGRGL